MGRTVEEGHISRRRAAPARISACTCPTTLGDYFNQCPMQQLSALLQIQSGSDCPHESLFKIGLNSKTSQSSSATKDNHYLLLLWLWLWLTVAMTGWISLVINMIMTMTDWLWLTVAMTLTEYEWLWLTVAMTMTIAIPEYDYNFISSFLVSKQHFFGLLSYP